MQDLLDKLTALLKEQGITIATAESCTGGLLSASLTHKAGSSEIFDRGFITYSNDAKMDMLEVPEDVLSNFGAVSAQTAELMAKGALKNSKAGITISLTGIAGPGGGSEAKPVGLVFCGYALENGSSGRVEFRFKGDRSEIRMLATSHALEQAINLLEGQT